eukprot:TRINITY_DN38911_c0_g1_i1.p1 TRINITY_DN38911_c0_g1~~TRINITY_DN38911_c0_g1_i1.p1  ORF type:complete len:120 (+),score=23.82 TRINITY_DN38911_c0_g1_i1:62-421(+)
MASGEEEAQPVKYEDSSDSETCRNEQAVEQKKRPRAMQPVKEPEDEQPESKSLRLSSSRSPSRDSGGESAAPVEPLAANSAAPPVPLQVKPEISAAGRSALAKAMAFTVPAKQVPLHGL